MTILTSLNLKKYFVGTIGSIWSMNTVKGGVWRKCCHSLKPTCLRFLKESSVPVSLLKGTIFCIGIWNLQIFYLKMGKLKWLIGVLVNFYKAQFQQNHMLEALHIWLQKYWKERLIQIKQIFGHLEWCCSKVLSVSYHGRHKISKN